MGSREGYTTWEGGDGHEQDAYQTMADRPSHGNLECLMSQEGMGLDVATRIQVEMEPG